MAAVSWLTGTGRREVSRGAQCGLEWLESCCGMARVRRWFEQLEFQWLPRKVVAPEKPKVGAARKGKRDEEMTEWCRARCRELRLRKLAEVVWVEWNGRLQSTAGRALWPDGRIELNPKLREVGEAELWRTLRHELAHLVAYSRARGRRIAPHGVEWERACADLGIPGERATHDLPWVSRTVKRHYAYRCRHCGSTVERVRRMRYQAACYECCRQHNGGRFDGRFKLVEQRL